MDTPMSEYQDVACHVKGCDALAVRSCDQCERPFCADHVHPHTIERREEPEESGGLILTRVPTRRETLFLCRYCGTKPILGKHPPIPDLT